MLGRGRTKMRTPGTPWADMEDESPPSDTGTEIKRKSKKLINRRLSDKPQSRGYTPEDIRITSRIGEYSNSEETSTDFQSEVDSGWSGSLSPSGFGSESKSKKILNRRLHSRPQSSQLSSRSDDSASNAAPSPEEEASEDSADLASRLPRRRQPLPRPEQDVSHLSSAELEELIARVRLDPQGHPTSIGSAGHDADCTPCLFTHSGVGCKLGILCDFCHFPHRLHGATNRRPNKGKRERYKKFMKQQELLEREDTG